MVELIQDYKDNLTYPSDTNLQECMKRVISMCQSELFNALLGNLLTSYFLNFYFKIFFIFFFLFFVGAAPTDLTRKSKRLNNTKESY